MWVSSYWIYVDTVLLSQALYLTSSLAFLTFTISNYPLSYRTLPGYPFNSLLGTLCSGRGLKPLAHSGKLAKHSKRTGVA